MGVEKGLAYRRPRSRMGGWRIACSPMTKTTVTNDRLEHRGYRSFTIYWRFRSASLILSKKDSCLKNRRTAYADRVSPPALAMAQALA